MSDNEPVGPRERVRAGKRDGARRRALAQKVADGTLDEALLGASARAALRSRGFSELVAEAKARSAPPGFDRPPTPPIDRPPTPPRDEQWTARIKEEEEEEESVPLALQPEVAQRSAASKAFPAVWDSLHKLLPADRYQESSAVPDALSPPSPKSAGSSSQGDFEDFEAQRKKARKHFQRIAEKTASSSSSSKAPAVPKAAPQIAKAEPLAVKEEPDWGSQEDQPAPRLNSLGKPKSLDFSTTRRPGDPSDQESSDTTQPEDADDSSSEIESRKKAHATILGAELPSNKTESAEAIRELEEKAKRLSLPTDPAEKFIPRPKAQAPGLLLQGQRRLTPGAEIPIDICIDYHDVIDVDPNNLYHCNPTLYRKELLEFQCAHPTVRLLCLSFACNPNTIADIKRGLEPVKDILKLHVHGEKTDIVDQNNKVIRGGKGHFCAHNGVVALIDNDFRVCNQAEEKYSIRVYRIRSWKQASPYKIRDVHANKERVYNRLTEALQQLSLDITSGEIYRAYDLQTRLHASFPRT